MIAAFMTQCYIFTKGKYFLVEFTQHNHRSTIELLWSDGTLAWQFKHRHLKCLWISWEPDRLKEGIQLFKEAGVSIWVHSFWLGSIAQRRKYGFQIWLATCFHCWLLHDFCFCVRFVGHSGTEAWTEDVNGSRYHFLYHWSTNIARCAGENPRGHSSRSQDRNTARFVPSELLCLRDHNADEVCVLLLLQCDQCLLVSFRGRHCQSKAIEGLLHWSWAE